LREYRRASSAAIDASLKPMMQAYIGTLEARLRDAGFAGRLLIVTSQGGVMDASDVADAPIHIVNSGPSMAPVAGRAYAALDEASDTAIIADTGGTTFDVSLVSGGSIPRTRETWIGQPFRGHMTGFPSVDVKSIGAGGGSIAWVDGGGLLHVGPQSAGADPGPACYAQGGTCPTVSDAALVLGYLDPRFFLGGRIGLDADAAREAISRDVCEPLGLAAEDAAAAILNIATENMVQAIADITVNQGIDPASAILIGGGGAAGLNSVQIARRLGCRRLLIPDVGAGLSAAGAMMSDLMSQLRRAHFAASAAFDFDGVNAVLDALEAACRAFADGPGAGSLDQSVELMAEARYPDQVWEIEVLLPVRRFAGPADVAALVEAFHQAHEDIFAIRDAHSGIEIMAWVATVRCRLRETVEPAGARAPSAPADDAYRSIHFLGHGRAEARVLRLEHMKIGEAVNGPAVIESPFTAIVVDPGATVVRRPSGSLSLAPGAALRAEGSA
jgi:N-methylhydantoinase A